MFKFVVDRTPEINKPLSAKYKKSFAYPTFTKRIPDIIQGIADRLKNKEDIKKKYGEDASNEADIIITKILDLKNRMQSDNSFVEISLNGRFVDEVNVYNKVIQQFIIENNGNPPSWFQTEWLFAECYLYFKLYEIFSSSDSMKNYDPFLQVKIDTLMGSKAAILILSCLLIDDKNKISLSETENKNRFMFFLKCSLWGNKADLSLSGGKPVAANEGTFANIDSFDRCILVNDMEAVYNFLCENENNVIDIILDNAGYELFNDLCFADFLIWSGLAKKIVFHCKLIPWFVSDATVADFNLILNYLETKIISENTAKNVKSWTEYLQKGSWEIKFEPFWILPYDYSKMQKESSQLYCDLAESNLLIFKGDLNYRKLVGDIHWEPTVSFRDALRGFEPTNILALRTIKADTISGLRKGVFEELSEKEPNWMITGKYALVQFLKK